MSERRPSSPDNPTPGTDPLDPRGSAPDASAGHETSDKAPPPPARKRANATILGVAPQSPTRPVSERPPPILVRSGGAKSEVDILEGLSPPAPENQPSPEAPLIPPVSVETPFGGAMPNAEVPAPGLFAPETPFAGEMPSVRPEPEHEPAGTEQQLAELSSARPSTRLSEVLSTPMTLAGITFPLWAFCVVPVVLLLLGLGIAIGHAVAGPSADERPLPVPSASSTEAPIPSAITHEATIDDATLKALESKGEASLTSTELLTLAEGRRQRELKAAIAFRESLAREPRSIGDRAVAATFRGLLDNRDTARDALAAIAALPAPTGPDIIYEVWTGTSQRTDVTELARMLAYTKDVRAKASLALAVALDLRAAQTCEQSRDVLHRAQEQGDRRSLHLLAKLTIKSGCGPSKKQDCYPCLRDGDDLKNALSAVKGRPAPTALPPP